MFKRKSGTLNKKQAAQQREQRQRAESTQAAQSDNNDDSDRCCVICMDKDVEQQRQLGQVFLSHSVSLNSFLSLK